MALTPAQRRLRGKIAVNTRWSREDPAPTAARGQAGLQARFEREVDPEEILPPEERARRAKAAHKAHMQRLALRSAQIRGARKATAAAEATPAC
jgi:hypothetical protein